MASIILTIDEWTLRAKRHQFLVGPIADAFVKRRSLSQKHPVHDFLFSYYSISPLKLKQWIPSFEEDLLFFPQLHEEYPWLNEEWFRFKEKRLSLRKEKISENTKNLVNFVSNLCKNILERPPRYNCFGLHEWAMVYKSSPEDIRHKGQRLRLSPEKLAAFVESQTICCSHYDAYRFFTPEARPLNKLTPVLETRLQMEQGGCIHANMDLYKWAGKLWPWIGSDLLAETFMLALKGREIDMRASPYDLSAQGYQPICIETEEGRKEYQKEQRIYAEYASALRKKLGAFCDSLILYLSKRSAASLD